MGKKNRNDTAAQRTSDDVVIAFPFIRRGIVSSMAQKFNP
jgi:hypothetical protein